MPFPSLRHIAVRSVAIATATALVALAAVASSASASHSWGSYHWAKTQSGTFANVLKLGDNVSGDWDAMLRTTSADWSVDPYTGPDWLRDSSGATQATTANPVRTDVVAGSTSPRKCAARSGRVEVCNEKYGRTGWLGVAQIWASGSHITQATAKMNDTYLSTARYAAYRMPVMCQEVGHAFGLGHQGEDDTHYHTCMDYSAVDDHSDAPNFHDYELLHRTYAHADESTTIDTSATALATKPGSVPYRTNRQDHRGGSTIVEHFADNSRKITHIRWVPDRPGHAGHDH